MAFDTYMQFKDSTGTWLSGESQVVISGDSPLGTDISQGSVFEIDDFSFDIEQVLNIGSASSGAGAGKITFNPFQITRKTDRASPKLFMMCCTGEHFQMVSLYLRRAGGMAGIAGAPQASSGFTFLRYDFALVAVKTVSWSGADGDEAMKEEVTFEYGALQVRYIQQDVSGKPVSTGPNVGTWNRVTNNASFNIAGITLTAATGKS
jgi:type VI secretion system secreted protein Hcp